MTGLTNAAIELAMPLRFTFGAYLMNQMLRQLITAVLKTSVN